MDLVNNTKVVQALKPATITASTNGIVIDLQGFESLMFNIGVGTPAAPFDGTNKFTWTVEEGDNSDGSGMAGIAAGDYIASRQEGTTWDRILDATADKDKAYQIGVTMGVKRYRRIVVTEAGTVSCILSVDAVLGTPRHAPAGVAQAP